MTQKQLIEAMAARAGITKKAAAIALKELAHRVIQATARGEFVEVRGFGTWSRRRRKSRRIRNPQTHDLMRLPVSYTIGFRAAGEAKEFITARKRRPRPGKVRIELDVDGDDLARQVMATLEGASP